VLVHSAPAIFSYGNGSYRKKVCVTAIAARVFEIMPDAYPAIRQIFSINTYGFFAVSTSCNAGQGWARGTGFLVSLSSSFK